jgi:hypothetical protein
MGVMAAAAILVFFVVGIWWWEGKGKLGSGTSKTRRVGVMERWKGVRLGCLRSDSA